MNARAALSMMPSFFAVVELAASRWLKFSVVVESLLATWRVVIFEHLVTIWLFLVFSSEGDAATALRCTLRELYWPTFNPQLALLVGPAHSSLRLKILKIDGLTRASLSHLTLRVGVVVLSSAFLRGYSTTSTCVRTLQFFSRFNF